MHAYTCVHKSNIEACYAHAITFATYIRVTARRLGIHKIANKVANGKQEML